jgi:hypothetical protein
MTSSEFDRLFEGLVCRFRACRSLATPGRPGKPVGQACNRETSGQNADCLCVRLNRLIEGFFVFIGAPDCKEPKSLSLQPDRFSDRKVGSDLSQSSLDPERSGTGIRKGLIEHLQPFGPLRRSGTSRKDRLGKMLRIFLPEAPAVNDVLAQYR